MTGARKAVLFVSGMTASGWAEVVFTDDFEDGDSDLAVTDDPAHDD